MNLYKYLTFDRIDIFKNQHIRFTQPMAFNDPFELWPVFQGMAPEHHIDKAVSNFVHNENEIKEMLEKSWAEECKKNRIDVPFSLVYGHLKQQYTSMLPSMLDFAKNAMRMKGNQRDFAISALTNSINESFGILCLTDICNSILMWLHYSGNHTGFVIEFDGGHAFFDQRSHSNQIAYHVRKVTYSKTRPEFTLFNPDKSDEEVLDSWVNDFLWIKSSDWSYENEWRMIYPLRDCKKVLSNYTPHIYLFPLPIDCIKSIIFGCKSSSDDGHTLIRFLNSANIKYISYKEAVMDDREYKLNILPYKYPSQIPALP